MLPAAKERIPALASGEETFSLAAGVALAALETHQGPHAAQGKKPHQGIFSKNRTIASGATWAKWLGTHQDRKCSWSKTVVGSALDANGNTLGDGSKTYTWDVENRLTSVTVPGTGTTTFRYDPFGRRIQKSGPLGTTNFLYDGISMVEEVDSAGNLLARYTYGQDVDQPFAEVRSGTTSYYQHDALNSVTSLTNPVGALANTYTYDSFGKLSASTGTLTNPFQYTGREFDQETGIYFYRMRYFDQNVGRFLSEDPTGFHAGVNFYSYVANDPVRFVDPLGLQRGGGTLPNVPGNCLSYALGYDEALGPDRDGAADVNDPNWPLTWMPRIGHCTPIPCDANAGCKKKPRRKVIVFVDTTNQDNWHVMRQLCNGKWASKNGEEMPVIVPGSPIQYYINEFHPGNTQVTCWSCPWPAPGGAGGFGDQ